MDCENLSKLVFGENLEIIGDYAFKGCINLKQILIFPTRLQFINKEAFYQCKGLTGLFLNEGLRGIEKKRFMNVKVCLEI
jgi:hypothetical protein